jgi:hypothetical protein
MTDIIHEILSNLHHLLSIASVDELKAAARLPNASPKIRSALESLADEKTATQKWCRSTLAAGGKVAAEKRTRTPAIPKKPRATVPSRDLFRSLGNISKEEIVELAGSFDIEIPSTPKDARSRILRRLENAVNALPEEKRQHIISNLAGGIDRQTAGWVDLIKKGK